jgi:hypothetical protein
MRPYHHFCRFFREILTARDNRTFEIGHVGTFIGTVAYFYFSYTAYVLEHQHWEPVQWGLGLGSIIGLGCTGISLKENNNQGNRPMEQNHDNPPPT